MKLPQLAIVVSISLAGPSLAIAEKKAPTQCKSPSSELGVPLGAVVRIQGVFFDGSKLREKATDGLTLLRVLKVNGKPLKSPPLVRFRDLSQYSLVPKKDGRTFDGFAYATGAYVGIPFAAFKYIPAMTTSGHHWQTTVVLLNVAKK